MIGVGFNGQRVPRDVPGHGRPVCVRGREKQDDDEAKGAQSDIVEQTFSVWHRTVRRSGRDDGDGGKRFACSPLADPRRETRKGLAASNGTVITHEHQPRQRLRAPSPQMAQEV